MSPEEQRRQAAEEDRQIEELVASCMKDEGFDYVPNIVPNDATVSGDEASYDPDSERWVSQYGYGIINSPFNKPQMNSNHSDPNADYVASLSGSEQQAYSDALYGPPLPDAEQAAIEDGTAEYDWKTLGCYGAAQHEVYDADDISQDDRFKDLFMEIESIWQVSQSAPEWVSLDAEWSACMELADYPGFAVQFDAEQSIYEQQNTLYQQVPVDSNGDPIGVVDSEDLNLLGQQEIDLALSDLRCREEINYRARAEVIQTEVEENFIADHKVELDAMRAAAAQD